MSTLKVEIVNINDIEKHPNADALELAHIKGWICVVKKGVFKKGDKCLYIPIDSVLPDELEQKLFGKDSKIKLNNGRIKTIKLRGAISQGLIVDLKELGMEKRKVGDDVTKELGIVKYEPPKERSPGCSYGKVKRNHQTNPNFYKYTDIENYKNYPNVFQEGEEVFISEKIHGSNWRAGYVEAVADTFWKKIKRFFNKLPKYEFVYGSHNVQLQNKSKNRKGFYDTNIYYEIVEKYDIKKKIAPCQVLYGEVYGGGIQANYDYGCAPGEHKLVIFDVQINGKYLNALEAKAFCEDRALPFVPVLYQGPFNLSKVVELTKGNSVLCPTQKIREGIVVKPLIEQACHMGRKILKYVSDEYLLLKNNTDFH